MNARIRSAVLSDSERPRSIWRNRFGSPNAFMPKVVGLRPVRPRNALTRDLNSCSSVSMPITVKSHSQARQLIGNVLNACSGQRYPVWCVGCRVAPPVTWQTPSAALARGSRQGSGARPGGRPGHGRFGIVHQEWQTSNAGLERGRRAPQKAGKDVRSPLVRRPAPVAPRGTARFPKQTFLTAARPGARNGGPTQPVRGGFSRMQILRARAQRGQQLWCREFRDRLRPDPREHILSQIPFDSPNVAGGPIGRVLREPLRRPRPRSCSWPTAASTASRPSGRRSGRCPGPQACGPRPSAAGRVSPRLAPIPYRPSGVHLSAAISVQLCGRQHHPGDTRRRPAGSWSSPERSTKAGAPTPATQCRGPGHGLSQVACLSRCAKVRLWSCAGRRSAAHWPGWIAPDGAAPSD